MRSAPEYCRSTVGHALRLQPADWVPSDSVFMTATARRSVTRALWVTDGRQVLGPRSVPKLTTLVGERGEVCLASPSCSNFATVAVVYRVRASVRRGHGPNPEPQSLTQSDHASFPVDAQEAVVQDAAWLACDGHQESSGGAKGGRQSRTLPTNMPTEMNRANLSWSQCRLSPPQGGWPASKPPSHRKSRHRTARCNGDSAAHSGRQRSACAGCGTDLVHHHPLGGFDGDSGPIVE